MNNNYQNYNQGNQPYPQNQYANQNFNQTPNQNFYSQPTQPNFNPQQNFSNPQQQNFSNPQQQNGTNPQSDPIALQQKQLNDMIALQNQINSQHQKNM